jgi:hypothetical protein
MALEGLNVLHAQGLLATAAAASAKLEPMLGHSSKEELASVCDRAERQIERAVDEITRQRVAEGNVRSDAEMITLDMAAVDALRDGKYRRHVCGNHQEVLACDQLDGTAAKCTKVDADKGKGPPLELAQTHLGLFRPPLAKRRRAA